MHRDTATAAEYAAAAATQMLRAYHAEFQAGHWPPATYITFAAPCFFFQISRFRSGAMLASGLIIIY